MVPSCKLQLCLMAITLVSVVHGHGDPNKKPKLLVKEFAKIDSHLSKKVATDSVELYMKEINIWLKKESSKLIKNKSLIEALKRFKAIEQIEDVQNCHNGSGRAFLSQFDKSLGYDATTMSGHPIRPIDKIAKHYGYNFADFCRDQLTEFVPNLEATFKQADYDIIDANLVSRVATNDLDDNFNEATEMSNQAPKGSHLAEALEQFLSLRRLIRGGGSCNYDGYQIRFKNDLAIRGESKVKVATRRIDQIILRAAEKHGLICRDEYRKNYNSLIGTLDELTKKTMHMLADNYLKPLLNVVWDHDLMEPVEPETETASADNGFVSDNEVIAARETVDSLVEGTQDARFCQAFGNRLSKIVNLSKLYDCYDKYLIKPCEVFKERVGNDVFVPQFYGTNNDGNIALPTTEDDGQPLSYNHGRAAHLICARLIKNTRWVTLRLAEKVVGL